LRGIEFIEFVEFLGLMKRKRVEGSIPMTISNTINSKNTATMLIRFEVIRL
jgi:hypothetical protein